MALEDNFLKLDCNNYDSEIKYRLDNKDILIEDLFQLFLDGYVPMETVIEALGYTLSLIHISEPTRPY